MSDRRDRICAPGEPPCATPILCRGEGDCQRTPPAAQPAPVRDGKDYGYGPTKAEGDAFMRSLTSPAPAAPDAVPLLPWVTINTVLSVAQPAPDATTELPIGSKLGVAPDPAEPPDDLVRRYACFTMEDGVYEHPQGEHVAYADYAKAAAAIVALTERVATLRRQERMRREELDKAEADNAALRAVVAAVVVKDGRIHCNDVCGVNWFDARAKLGEI